MDEYADLVTDPEMTEQLEEDMRRIADGEVTRDEVMDESREMLDRIFEILEEKEEEIADALHEGLMEDRTLGPCPDCEADETGSLVIRTSRSGDEFVGCDAYPDCEKTYPLPDDGKIVLIDERCDEHGLSHVKVLAGKSTYTHGCPVCKAEEAEDEDDVVIGDCPECGDTEGGELAIKQTRGGGRLVGCTRYPDCDYSLPLPRRGEIEVTDEVCDEHDLPELVVHQSWSDEPWELGCPICNYESYKAEQEKKKGLRAVEGIGPATEEKLEDAGVETVDELKEADPEELAESVDGVSASRIEKWQSA
jgi:DNA topoisomerase-1